jgi:hypothetical protein
VAPGTDYLFFGHAKLYVMGGWGAGGGGHNRNENLNF